jgi:hypothetical protein
VYHTPGYKSSTSSAPRSSFRHRAVGGTSLRRRGLLPIRQFDERIGLTQAIADGIDDPRDSALTEHTLPEMVRSRVHGILATYKDQNDHDTQPPESDGLPGTSAARSTPPSSLATAVASSQALMGHKWAEGECEFPTAGAAQSDQQGVENNRALARSGSQRVGFPGVRTKIPTGYLMRDFFTDSRRGVIGRNGSEISARSIATSHSQQAGSEKNSRATFRTKFEEELVRGGRSRSQELGVDLVSTVAPDQLD